MPGIDLIGALEQTHIVICTGRAAPALNTIRLRRPLLHAECRRAYEDSQSHDLFEIIDMHGP